MHWKELIRSEAGSVRIAVVGEGAETSLIPAVQQAALSESGIASEVISLEVSAAEFDQCIRHLQSVGFRGVNVCSPHKVSAARLAERFYVAKHSLGVANALSLQGGIFAQNTEVPAFIKTIEEIEPGKAFVMGSGHGARSVVLGLLERGWKINLWSRSGSKARLLRTLLARYGDIQLIPQPDPSGCCLIVNATSLGLKIGEKTPLIWNYAKPKSVVYDLIYRRVPTEFVREAKLRGMRTIDGKDLLVEQAALALEWWLDQPVPRDPMREAVRRFYASG